MSNVFDLGKQLERTPDVNNPGSSSGEPGAISGEPRATGQSSRSIAAAAESTSNQTRLSNTNYSMQRNSNISAIEDGQIFGYNFGGADFEVWQRTRQEASDAMRNRDLPEKEETERFLGLGNPRSLGSFSESYHPVQQATADEEGWQMVHTVDNNFSTCTLIEELKMKLQEKADKLEEVELHNKLLRKELHNKIRAEQRCQDAESMLASKVEVVDDLTAENMALNEQVMQFKEDFEAERRAFKEAVRHKRRAERDCKVYEQERDLALQRARNSESEVDALKRENLRLQEMIHSLTLSMTPRPATTTSTYESVHQNEVACMDTRDHVRMETNLESPLVHSSGSEEFCLLASDVEIDGKASNKSD